MAEGGQGIVEIEAGGIGVHLGPEQVHEALTRHVPAQVQGQIGQDPADFVDYAFLMTQRARPLDPEQFSTHLRNALTSPSGDPTVLVVSSYSGNVWWGGSYYGYFADPLQQLGRESPARGCLYIRLNIDKLAPREQGWNDPAFWASKMAHELLHNLGYWHPDYKDPAERDANNKDNNWAFIVSYEAAIYESLKGGK